MTDTTHEAPEQIGLISDGFGQWALAHRDESNSAVHYILKSRSDDLVQAERERCARVAETEGVAPWTNTNQPEDSWYKHGQRIAAVIREGGK